MDIHAAIEDTMVNLNLFLNNRFAEAKKRMEPWWGYISFMYSVNSMINFGNIGNCDSM